MLSVKTSDDSAPITVPLEVESAGGDAIDAFLANPASWHAKKAVELEAASIPPEATLTMSADAKPDPAATPAADVTPSRRKS